ncbi:uncharacterized protein BT62DRAFT_938531 [Guyanagaster necrorhizus]|uniref:Uncharacterized protein n=1 Tax=Guyanagaster necrorhizus TaxID=856835 RepID=A0A9P7VG61_9AGAR|nr:uncharacterized protein BT62DRAFT_938531 [Guyanagaster necrorhizus MCA 3950]KAG7439945.1 hypothetical protein BT62DRAFT_938531 [Guyanagaster necrorhizus MCA 3950]
MAKKSRKKENSITRPTLVALKGIQAYIKSVAGLASTVLEIIDTASTNRKDIDEFVERIWNTITTLKTVADRYSRAGNGDVSDVQGVCDDFQQCLEEILSEMREIQKGSADKSRIMQYLMITDVRDKIDSFVQRAGNLQRDFDIYRDSRRNTCHCVVDSS